MRRTGPSKVNLGDLAIASAVLERKWTTSVLFHLAQAPARFGDLRRALGTISEKVLIQRLRALEAEGLISRRVHGTVPPEVTYSMTPHGRSLCSMIEVMATWGGIHRRYRAREKA
jgi:DNA-binding HxlR family transcriptional regulator